MSNLDPNLLNGVVGGCKYYAYFMQGGGCDYTIGCGFKLVPLMQAKDMETAKEQALAWIDGHVDPDYLDEIIIIEGTAAVIGYERMLAEIREEEQRQEKARKAEEHERLERQEYERLRKKYEQ